jgi:hypothetical protein
MVHPTGHGNYFSLPECGSAGNCIYTFECPLQILIMLSHGGIYTGATGRRQYNHTSMSFMSLLLYCGIQGEYGTKNTTQTAFKKSLTTFIVSDRFVCGLLPTMGMVPNTISITRGDNQCHPTPTAVKISSLFADCASCWESRSLSHGRVRRIESVL